jgi:hypothetical protein
LNINSPCCDISGHKYVESTSSERVQSCITLLLANVAMEGLNEQ